MTIVRLKWADTAATDLHLITGLSSPELVRLLRVDDLTGETLTPELRGHSFLLQVSPDQDPARMTVRQPSGWAPAKPRTAHVAFPDQSLSLTRSARQ